MIIYGPYDLMVLWPKYKLKTRSDDKLCRSIRPNYMSKIDKTKGSYTSDQGLGWLILLVMAVGQEPWPREIQIHILKALVIFYSVK